MMLRHLSLEDRQKLLLMLVWCGAVGRELGGDLQRLLRIALTGIVIDADAVRAPAAATLEMLQRAVLAVMSPEEWHDPEKTTAENNIAMRDVVRAARLPVEEVAIAADEFIEALGEEQACTLAKHFEEEVLPTFVVLADHIFEDAVGH